ncbi:hypothetical protein [Salinigranum sp. GCM10025319]|uniref:hypothetical protein n=1 Tax=Salinigranum sp. GCM10025319 TaxID=3252687 RepID=UPI00360AFAC1
MNAIVHFAVGATCGMVVLLAVDWRPQVEFPLVFASGGWALLPDGWYFLRYLGNDWLVAAGLALHRSVFANVFWFHQLLDRLESGNRRVEMASAVIMLGTAVAMFTVFNGWE